MVIQANAQSGVSAPYSAFGLGYLNQNNNARNMSMGGIGIGTRDYFTINIKNPASYSAFDTTSFVFEGAVAGNYLSLKSNDFNEGASTASLSHLLFGFPVTKWWKSSIGLVPFSTVGYDVNSTQNKEYIGNILYSYEGSGGISRFYWGNAIQPLKNLSIGFNMSYLFGTIDKSQNITFPDSAYRINSKINNQVSVGDLYFDFGIQYFKELKKNLKLVVGGTYHPKLNINAKRTYYARSYLGSVSGVEFFKDTIAYFKDDKGKITIPEGYGIGFSLTKTDNWLVGFDYQFNKWKSYQSFDISDSLVNSHNFSAGGQLVPDYKSTSYLNRIDYRLGVKYSMSYLQLRDTRINGFGITFGVGLPLRSLAVRGSRSKINLGVEIGRRGTLDNELIQENYINVYLGVSIYERWFIKRRYN